MAEAEDASVTAAMLFPFQAEAIRFSYLLGSSAESEERNLEKFEALLKPYQELPQALDQCLAELCNNLMLRIHTSPACCRGMYLLCKIRGRKSISRLLPKQVNFLDEAIELLSTSKCWESKYVGLVWLSLLILLPFELDSITDTSTQDIQQTIISFLGNDKPTRDPASLCLAKLLTRRDFHEEMVQFLQQDTEEIGLLLTKAAVFKRTSNWQDVAPLAMELFPRTLQQCLLHFDASNTMRKIVYVKLLQRMFTAQDLHVEHCEMFANFILTRALGDSDSRVRWQAAKSTRRFIENDIPEIYEAVLDLFTSEQQDEDLWHGACLAVGEMIRTRKIINLTVKPTIRKCIVNALGFDRKRGTRSLGSNIRDAGCYVTWALVRCLPKQSFAVEDCQALAELLLVTSLFDREVSCRRAASAALQEAVGRLGAVPHGIDLLLLVSYQSVGNVNRAYGEVCTAVCQFPEYKPQLIDHLLQVKTKHWDETIRVLASEALGCNGSTDDLQVLLERISQKEINQFELHGGLLACAALFKHGLVCGSDLVASALEHTAMLITTVFPAQLVMLRNAWLALFQAACGMLPYRGNEHAQFVEDCLKQDETCVAATHALTALLSANNIISVDKWMFNVYALHGCLLAGVNLNQVLPELAECVQSRSNAHTDRIQALVALSNVNDLKYVDLAFSHCLWGLEDMTHSNQHGDVGSWVRRQACASLCALYEKYKQMSKLQFAIHRCAYFACDKLDHVREAAMRALFELTEHDDGEQASFYTLEQSFQRVTQTFLLTPKPTNVVQTSILCSLLLTAGSLNESPSQAAQDCLEQWYLDANTTIQARMRLYDSALFLLRRSTSAVADDTQTIAVCKSLAFVLLTLQHHRPFQTSPIWRLALVDTLTTAKPKRRVNISRQVAIAQVLLGLMTINECSFWPEFCALLTSEFPSLRKQVAEAFYLWASGLPDSQHTPNLRQAMDLALLLWEDGNNAKLEQVKQAFLLCMC